MTYRYFKTIYKAKGRLREHVQLGEDLQGAYASSERLAKTEGISEVILVETNKWGFQIASWEIS